MISDIIIVAGEPSGDMLAASILKSMKEHPFFHNYKFSGIGGPHMQANDFNSIWNINTLSVRGYVETLGNIFAILKIRKELLLKLRVDPPRFFFGVDAPDFNLEIEKKCRKLNIPTFHFISPSIWAWRGERIYGIKKAVDHMFCIFPFETEIYKKHGISATFVGHPLANSIPDQPNQVQAKEKLSLLKLNFGEIKEDETLIAVLPGSRKSEIKYIAPGFFKAISIMQRTHLGKIRFLIPVAIPLLLPALEELKNDTLRENPDVCIELISSNSSLILEACDSVLIASGTATLEAALWKKPMVISYTVPWLTAQIMKRKAYLPYIGLPNILLKKFIVPELLQDKALPMNLARETLAWLNQPDRVTQLKQEFNRIHQSLKLPTAEVIVDVIEKNISAYK
jgi:lipid-A-disaccharide synthase